MATEAKNTNYWISSSALYIQLNAMGEPDYIQCSVVSGASILCYMQGIPGLEYDAGHNYQRWPLAAYPSVFPDSERKYIYAAIPRTSTADNNTAMVVYPSERIDLYGYSIANPDKLVGDERYYYIYLQGIISEVKTDADGKTRKRDWLQHVDCGKLNTDESLSSGIDGTWWKYNSVTDSISFLKTILSATFDTLTAKVAKITKLFLGGSELNGVANDLSLETDNTKVVTPLYLGQFGVKHFLAKDKDDVAHGAITFEKVQKFLAGLNVGDSNSENGGSWAPDAEGRSHLITDYLEVRMKAIFEELVIKKTSTIGGKEIISPAGGVVAHKVEEVTVTYNNVSQKAYRCYFLAEQEGDSVDNDFAVNDQVRSESFNVRKGTYHKVGNHFYWRLVIGRDEDPVELEGKKYHYIDLSDTDCATASDVPAKGDVLSQCGNRTDVERQNCLIFSAVDTYSPSISLYHGINSYSFANREYVQYGVNKQTNKAFFNVYGDMYVGDRPTKENGYEGSSYIKYDSATKQVSVKGKISAKSTVDGKELSQYIKENSAKGLTEEQVNNLIKNSQVITDLQNQVDGAIETWFYEGVPTLNNAPASSWTTDKDKDTHLGDLYYDNKTGKAYRFAKDGNTYKWTIITDTDIAKALSDASKAQETADGKMKVFSTQPIPPYQLGDIWVNATYPTDGRIYKNEILRCQTAKAKDSSFAIADWTKASKYTDDSALNTFKEEYKNDMASYKEQLDEKVETWFYNYAPTTQNKPASDWTTDTLKSQHAGDLFYNTSNGYTYRWTGTAWARIKDNDINTAMTAASKAQDTADGKRTVFTSQPTVPYDEGDLWASGGDDGKTLMVCVKSRATGSFTSSEWVKANDSDLNAFAKTIEESLTGIRDQLDKKAETWYQATDPSTSWTTDDAKKEHKGDLWYNTSNNQTFFWNGTKWDKQDVPTEVFDKIDGKSSIYVSKPASYEERDLWILEAAYTLGGVAYSKGELVVATKSNASFSAADWTKKVKYTDDTVANTAKKAAEEAKKAADTAQTNVTNLGKTVTSNKKAFDNYVTDGYLEPSEIAAMAQDSKRLEDAFAAAEKSYTEVKEAAVLKDTKELTDLNTAFVTLSTAKTELIKYLSDISARYNAANTEEKATIVSAVGTKFTNFQSAYSAFYDKLGLANAYITSKIYGDLGVVIGDVTSLAYLKKALMDTSDTEINGGLILTSLIGLRDTGGNTTAGINGITEKSAKGGGVAAWFGGEMVDKDYNDGSKTPANTIFRFDGSGYVAGGAIWWGTDGRVHADPTSFIISEKNLGAYLTFFEPTWKSGSAGTSVADLVSLKPNAPFSKLGVSGDATFEGAITFHGIKLTYDATNKAIKIDGNLYATGGITAYGAGTSTSTGGGLNGSVKSYSDALKLTSESLSEVASAYSIKALSRRIDNIATELGGLSLSWDNITGKPSTFAPSAHTHKWAEITDRITKVSQLTNDSGYTKNTGTVTSVSLTLPAGLTCATKTITTSGTFAISLASGYSIPTTAKQTAWDSAYDWYALMTTDEETADGIINKWNEVVSFLANIAQTDTLSGIVDGINKSISDEVARAKKAEGVNASGISANKGSIATLQGYFTNGSAKKALQLTNARKLWGNSFNGTADINGSIIVPSGKYISIGNIKLEYDAANKALKITNTTTEEVANLYTSGGVSAYGVGTSSSSGGGLNGSVKSYSDALKLTSESLSEIASAYSIKALASRISSLEGGSATSIETTGSGNAVTSVSKSGTKITFTKGSTFSLNGHTHTFASLTSKPTSLSGYGITDGVNAVSVTGSGNAITTASISGHTLTLTKGSSFSLSNHTHYVGTTRVQGSSAEQALTGITKIDNILKLSKATVTVNTSYKAEQNRLVIYGNTYGNDANYIKSAGKLSYGDGGPQLVFSTNENPDASGVQSAALVYTDHDTIGAGVSLSFVTNQGDAYFIAPHIKALTAFQGNLAWSYITNKPTTLSGFGITDGLRSVTQPSGSNVFVTGISTSGTAIAYTKSYTKKSLSAVGTSGWTNASIDGNIIPDMSFIAYWNGAYSGTSSNLAYCNKGAFGSFAIKNSLAFSELTSKPTTISGYGITDAYTKSQVDAIAAKYLPLTGGTLTGQLKIVASALNGAYNGLLMGDDCYIGDCNFANTIGLMGVSNNNAGMVKFGKGGMQFGYNGSNHIASTTAQWTNLNADLLDGWHKDNIVWSGAVNSNTANLSHYWAKLFDITVTGNQYNDINFTFLFSNGYNDTYSVVVLRIRQNGAKDSGAYNFRISLRELVGNMSSRLRVYYNNATGNVQLWGNCQGQYGSLSYTIIKKTERTSADFKSQGTLVTNTSFSAAQSLPATTGDSPYTLLNGATRIGIVKQADQLVTARSLWGQSFNGTANVSGNMTGVGNINTSAAPAGTIYTNNWFRSKGSTGWYSEDHGGGWYMSDNTWIRNFGSKDVYLSNKLSVNGNVGIGTTAPSHKLHVLGDIYTTTRVNINGIILEKDSNGDLKVNGNLYATGGISAYGTSSAGSGGGLSGSVKSYADALKLTSESLSEIASAYSIKALASRISSLEGGSATSIETTGSGNAVTSVSKSGTKITFTKGSTFSLNGHTHTFASLTSKPTSLSGYGITDGVNAVSVTGSGNAITTASISGHTLTLTKGSSFSLSNHTHYVGTTRVQGSSAEQALTGITKIDNILKLSKATVTVNTSYKAEQNRLVIYGNTYGNDANYIKSAGKLSYGDGGPQLVFSTNENPDASGVQSAALVYTDHDTIGAGVSLSFVTNQGDAYFIAPHIKALTAFQGNLAWSYITNKPTTLSGFGITDGLRSVTQPSGSNVFVTGISTSGTAIAYTKSYTKKSLSAVGTSGWTNASIDGNIIPDMSFIAYWNGAYSGTSSNLAYCNKGAFGSFAIKNSLAFSELTSKPTTISGYGITDAYTKSQVDAIAAKYLPLTGGTLTGQLKIVASALNGAYNGLLMGDDCYIGDCNFANTIGLMGVSNNNAGMVKFGKGGMQFGYNGSNHIASTTAQWTNLNADLLDGWHKDNIVWSGAVNSNTANLSHYWAKLFDITVTGNQYNDINFTFLFSNGYNDTYSVVVLRIRQNGAKDSGAYNFRISLRELVGNMSSRLRVYYNNATGNVQLWGNCQGQYGSLSYTIIKKTERTSADFKSQGTLVTNTSFSAAQSLPATTGDSPYTLLNGATRIGIVKQADQLVTARSLWGQSFNGTANVSGNMTGVGNINTSAAPAGTIYTNNWFRSKGSTGWYSEDHGGGWYMSDNTWIRNFGSKDVYLSNKLSVNGNVGIGTTAPSHKLHVLGDIYTTTRVNINGIILEKDSNGDLKVNGNLYATGGISAYGTSSAGSGGGLSGSVKSYADALKLTSESLSEVASAYSIKQLSTRITSLEGGSATSISVSGSGNAVTSVTKNGTTISVVKGATFLTSHQSLAGYATQDWVNAKGYITSSGGSSFVCKNALPTTANNTVKAYKDSLVKFFENYPNGIGANVVVSASIIGNWSNDAATFYNSNNYSVIKIGGAYERMDYGQFLLSTYALDRVGIVGRDHNTWTAIKWLAYTDDIPKNNNQLTNGAGYITSAGSCKYATSAGSANSVAWSNVSGRPTKVSQFTNDSGYITSSASITGNAATATKVNHSLSVFGKSFNGSADVTVADTDLIASISTATANLTDKTEILTSYASDNGFNDSNAKNRIYRRPASAIWGYINSKTISNADKLDGVHASGLFTNLSNSGNNISITIGGTNKTLTAAYATNCDTVDGYHAQAGSSKPYGKIPVIGTDGVIELGHYIDFHHDNTTDSDYSVRLQTDGNHSNVVTLPTATGTLALTSDNVASATKLQTTRTLWGQSFNGTANISGSMTGVGDMTLDAGARIKHGSGNLYIGNSDNSNWIGVQDICSQSSIGDGNWSLRTSGAAHFKDTTINGTATINNLLSLVDGSHKGLKMGSTYISSLDGEVILQGNTALRFGNDAWDYNQWAGLKYDHSSKTVYLGIADGSIFKANSAQSGGVINLKQGISSVYTPALYAGGDIYHTGVYRMLWKNSKASKYLNVMNISQDDYGILTIGYGNFANNKNVVLEGYNLNFRVGNDSGMKSMWLNYNNGNPVLSLDGNFYATGGVTAYKSSDERLKHDIHGVDSLAIIKAMGGTVAFRYNADNKDSIGWIAQRVLHNTFMQDLVEKDDKGFLKINYWSPKLIAVAFGAIEQVDDEVSRLKRRVRDLENEVEQLKSDRL